MIDFYVFNTFGRDGLGTGELAVVHNVLVKVLLDDAEALVEAGDGELDELVHTVVDGPVELLGLVGREDNHKALVGFTGAVQKGVEGVAHVLRHVGLAAFAEERCNKGPSLITCV